MNRFSIAVLALASVLGASTAARADDFNFTFTSESTTGGNPDVYATGTLTGNQIGSTGNWQITSGTIDLTSDFLYYTGNGWVSTGSWDGADNLLTPGATGLTPLVDNGGMLFIVDGWYVDIYSIPLGEFGGPGTYSYGIVEQTRDLPTVMPSFIGLDTAPPSSPYGESDELVITNALPPAVTPEPPTVLLLASGLIALGFFAFRKPGQATGELGF